MLGNEAEGAWMISGFYLCELSVMMTGLEGHCSLLVFIREFTSLIG